MKRTVIFLGLAFLVGADDKPKTDDIQEKLKGTWEVVAVGMEKPKTAGVLVIDGDKWSLKNVDVGLGKGTYTADPGKKPAEIDFADSGDSSNVTEAIYELNGDTLRLAFQIALLAKAPRPTAFNGGPSVIVLELKRKK